MGTALRRSGRAAAALAALEKALAQGAEAGRTYNQVGLSQIALGRPDRALASLKQALAARPGDVFIAAEIANLEAARRHPDLPPGAKRVALHTNQRFHDAILRPLFEELAQRHRTIVTADARRLVEFDPDVVIVADAQSEPLRRMVPRAQFVFTRHGLISKNSPGRAAPMADYACITSEASKQWYIERGIAPRKGFWITGYVQADPLFRDAPLPLPFALPQGTKTVLYAPTFNDFLSSAPMLGPRTVALIRGARRDISIVIKPHPHICSQRAAWMDWWRKAAATEPGVFLVEDPAADLVPYLKAADLLVSDASSATMMYLALDRPIVLITNPDAGKDKERFDPNGPEWAWRDMGEEVFDISGLAAAVARGLDNPDERRERRLHYRRLLFGDLTDGHAVKRIAAQVTALEIERAP
jgi:CDP-glycerol glycerophosphotransferase (TagB/SpsB family)